MATSNLQAAKLAKNDEFYTQRADIEKELRYYKEQFNGKVVYCNCDDPYESYFFQYFAANFNALKLKKLITTSYVPSPIAWTQLALSGIGEPKQKIESVSRSAQNGDIQAWKFEIREVIDEDLNGAVDLKDIAVQLKANKKNELVPISGKGDFRSPVCINLLKQADIVCTNPPFSLFREYVARLIEHNKKFLIIGNDNAIAYKEFFKYIKENKVWMGYSRVKEFRQPDGTIKKFGNVGWYTNLDTTKRHEKITPYKKYNPEEYPKYHNYDAIEVSKVTEIPDDYDGAMGVPITFLDKYNPDQFEILGSSRNLGKSMKDCAPKGTYVQGGIRFYLPNNDGTFRRLYDRIVIKKKGN